MMMIPNNYLKMNSLTSWSLKNFEFSNFSLISLSRVNKKASFSLRPLKNFITTCATWKLTASIFTLVRIKVQLSMTSSILDFQVCFLYSRQQSQRGKERKVYLYPCLNLSHNLSRYQYSIKLKNISFIFYYGRSHKNSKKMYQKDDCYYTCHSLKI